MALLRLRLGTYGGQARFRVSPPGLDVRNISAEQCLLSEAAGPRLQTFQSGSVRYVGDPITVLFEETASLPFVFFYTVQSGSSWQFPAYTGRSRVTVSNDRIVIRNLEDDRTIVYLVMKR